ncbi:alpha/beta fold hydrolase [Eoetvoesiella caeni]|uniref:Pimeloyl-ACP methyl ester carboxylesterase n=1 Tax=Eoetvoesiella caeni TaxID=645616 RepID=A0A366HKG1_9BURK|nr:alpha/beta hydrolase [Eoetvoesiella caeni]MCI2807555.1 alpha/beta hydrolase [Eoetvoesiella caeni]NYT53050.1 alpha/beta hydrolase [Eoetvoesiella caeni]RBP43027.1 pimeloyl-ACP methyl ester carboxylesterase [Eoetvoesiella caeni]
MKHVADAASVKADQDELELAFPERQVSLGTDNISFRECGQGPQTVLLLHGISSGAASWAQCARILGEHARVIAWNAPGYGASSPLPMAVPSARDYARRLDAMLAELNIDRCLLVGHSLGALMAAAYGGLPGQRAWHRVLISPALGYQSDAKKHLAAQIRAKRFEALERDGLELIAQKLPDRLLTAAATQRQRQIVTENALRLDIAGYKQAVEMLCGENIEQYDFDPAACDVFCGQDDVVTTAEQTRDFARRAGLPFALIEDAGHACYVEQPARVAQVLSKLVRNQDDRVAG